MEESGECPTARWIGQTGEVLVLKVVDERKPDTCPTTLYVPLQGFGGTSGLWVGNRKDEKCRYLPFIAVGCLHRCYLPQSAVFRCFLNVW
jgi:hypothetical protein